MQFKELDIIKPVLKALDDQQYTEPTPIQAKAIPLVLNKEDVLGCAQTGTGKTAAFAIPIIQHLYLNVPLKQSRRKIKALVITPTRELAIQIGDSFTTYSKYTQLRNTVIFGGVKHIYVVKKEVGFLPISIFWFYDMFYFSPPNFQRTLSD